jgi:G3E family GTPase
MTNHRRPLVPVTLVAGFQGSGKTTLIEALKNRMRSQRVATLKDDGEIDLFAEIEQALEVQAADVVLVECAANLEPYFVAEQLVYGDEMSGPPDGMKVDTAVTVVDTSTFLRQMRSEGELLDLDLAFDEEDDRMVAELLIEQIEFADVIVLNKIDRVEKEELAQVESFIERLNPRAKILPTTQGEIAPDEVVDTGYFDFEDTDDGAGWLAELRGDFAESEAAKGVKSFTFSERRPFHPIRFNELLSDLSVKGLVRAKGYVWVATRHHEIGIWSVVGQSSLLTYGGAWFAATPAREWPRDERERAEIMKEWTPPFGDRRQEIAFIGIAMDEAEIKERLRECLLTYNEMKDGPDSWFSIPDPLPDWHVDTDPEAYGESDGWS